ncbi:MAG: V-type ATP synthase subunit E [Planctomycetaceae bacterium]|nr:V-type ATP synthase subunit E [Planctomycetaceae bacterium]
MSLESVKSKVLDEARARADAKLAEAKAEADRIRAEGKAVDDRAGQEAVRDATLRLERETVRELERIGHDNRLQILSAKNNAIDEVFKRVRDKVASLSDGEYLELVGVWLDALPAEVGGVLRVNPKDEAMFNAGLITLNRNRSGAGQFTGVVADAKVAAGAIVDGPDYSIDCTVDRRLGELRETAVGDLARVLFGA